MTPHISAKPGDIAETVLMPGDPLRARFIAENYLDSPVCFNEVRGMLGYTGRHKGTRISVMGSGMGMPSIGIYAHELFSFYGVEEIVRIGSCGGYSEGLALFDLLLATAAWSESTFSLVQGGCFGQAAAGFAGDELLPSPELCARLRNAAVRLGLPLREGTVHSSDVFYRADTPAGETPYWQRLRDEKGCLAVEMESYALFACAKATGKQAACLLTVSDSFLLKEKTTSEEREKSFTAMMEVALGIVA